MGASTRRKAIRRTKFAHIRHDEPRSILGSRKTPIRTVEESGPGASSIVRQEPKQTEEDVTLQTTNGAAKPVISDVRKGRFICFIGNLPFSATTEALSQHFRRVSPSSIRHSTSKETGKSKGFAFVEFSDYDRMKTCLKLYHHSLLDDGISPARKINVELTAGGGGSKSHERKAKLRLKNEKLDEQRKRRVHEAAKPQDSGQTGKSNLTDPDIHPSRRDRIANRSS